MKTSKIIALIEQLRWESKEAVKAGDKEKVKVRYEKIHDLERSLGWGFTSLNNLLQ